MSVFPTPLIGTQLLAELLAHSQERPGAADRLVLLDGSMAAPGSGENVDGTFRRMRIPGARRFDIDAFSDPGASLPHMLPDADSFARGLAALGVGEDSQVVVYHTGALPSAARVRWMLRTFGHEAVSVLDGGLAKWQAEGRALDFGAPPPLVEAAPVERLRLRRELVASADDIRALQAARDRRLVDARSAARFRGEAPEPRAGLASGHIPGSVNLPFGMLLDASGCFLPVAELRRLFAEHDVPLDRPAVFTCGSGVTACVDALAFELAGGPDSAVYDAAWAEWGLGNQGPIATGPAQPWPLPAMETAP